MLQAEDCETNVPRWKFTSEERQPKQVSIWVNEGAYHKGRVASALRTSSQRLDGNVQASNNVGLRRQKQKKIPSAWRT